MVIIMRDGGMADAALSSGARYGGIVEGSTPSRATRSAVRFCSLTEDWYEKILFDSEWPKRVLLVQQRSKLSGGGIDTNLHGGKAIKNRLKCRDDCNSRRSMQWQ